MTVSRTATFALALSATEAEVATLSNVKSMLPWMAKAVKTAKVKLAKRVVLFEAVNMFISPNWGHCGPSKRMYVCRNWIAPGL